MRFLPRYQYSKIYKIVIPSGFILYSFPSPFSNCIYLSLNLVNARSGFIKWVYNI